MYNVATSLPSYLIFQKCVRFQWNFLNGWINQLEPKDAEKIYKNDDVIGINLWQNHGPIGRN